MLEDEPQTPATVRTSIENVDVIKSLVLAEGIIMEKTFFGFLRFDAVLAQMLDVSILLVFVIPLECVPQLGHESLPTLTAATSNLF
jgi:hypothetical protein